MRDEELLTQLTADRRALHRIPETDASLPETAAYLRRRLAVLPCAVFSPWESAVCAWFDFGKSETVAFRSDMDALPVCERSGLPFASTHEGRMHACGHDGHMAMLLSLADFVAAQQALPRNVLLIFEPAEETTGGAEPICKTGILEQYRVSRIFGLHLWPELPKNAVATRPGGMMARSAQLCVEITGKSVHLAHWREGADALWAAALFLQRVYALAEREQTCLLRFGCCTSGTVNNAVSDRSRLEGSLRCFSDGQFDRLFGGMERIARDVAAETGCSLHVGRSDGYRAVTNDAALLDAVRPAVPELREAPATYITEDFSAYQRRVPGVFFLLGTGGEALHSPQFTFDESVLLTGAALLRRLAVLGDAV